VRGRWGGPIPGAEPQAILSRSFAAAGAIGGFAAAGVVAAVPGHGSNPAHGNAKRKTAATKSAEVLALPLLVRRRPMDYLTISSIHPIWSPLPTAMLTKQVNSLGHR
jgi:hypothetical protein